MILLNARLVQDPVAVAGVMLRTFRAFEGTLLPVFHLEQFDPEDDKDTRGVEVWVGILAGSKWFFPERVGQGCGFLAAGDTVT